GIRSRGNAHELGARQGLLRSGNQPRNLIVLVKESPGLTLSCSNHHCHTYCSSRYCPITTQRTDHGNVECRRQRCHYPFAQAELFPSAEQKAGTENVQRAKFTFRQFLFQLSLGTNIEILRRWIPSNRGNQKKLLYPGLEGGFRRSEWVFDVHATK